MKRVLFIAYYWPPSGSSGVQRTLYFVKYLREFGWEPVVYIPENPEYPAVDESLGKEIPQGIEILKHPVWEPYTIYRWFTGRKSDERLKPSVVMEPQKGIMNALSVFVRGNFFIPDARCLWVNPSVRYLKKYLAKHPVDVIYSTSPPQSLHLIGLKLKQTLNIPWVADFRDPWTKISYFNHLRLTPPAKWYHHYLERKVLQNASKCVTVSPTCASDFFELGGKELKVITNGFDGEIAGPYQIDRLTLTYIGTLTQSRVPVFFWEVLNSLLEEYQLFPQFELRMIGNIETAIFDQIESAGLGAFVQRVSYIDHEEVPEELQKSFALLLFGIPGDKGVLTGKLFEYIQSNRPILAVGPEGGDMESVIAEGGFGLHSDYHQKETLAQNLGKIFTLYQQKRIWSVNNADIMKFHRRYLTGKLAELFNQVLS